MTVSQRLFQVDRDSELLWDVQSFVTLRYSSWMNLLSNLDAKLRVQMRIEISRRSIRDLSTTIIYVTHDQTEAMTLGTRIVVMKDGVVQQVDTPQNLYDKPCNLFVAGFMGSPQMNLINAIG